MKIECFLTDDEKRDVENFIKDMLKHKKISMEGTGGLEVHAERLEDCVIFSIHRVVGTVEVPILKTLRGKPSRSTKKQGGGC